ncbi:hypothetical protein SCUCBS95973_006361 [Sporothrix curviconia]|uniref:beta-glucosidase n=1 Tax=Sporothrix curviconia TaxID=1260050 RepID=A0ABP0C4G8_9PEZI
MAATPSDGDLAALLTQCTIEEKISLLSLKNVWETAAVDRVGIPSLKFSDGPNGARGADFFDGTTAACFPACVSLAAAFDRDLCHRVGAALGQEAQTKGAYVLLGPTVCCHRSPVGGRNFEAFSEDPFVSGALAIEYIRGLQSERVAATVKHYVANEQDTRRFTVNEIISERALREIYLKPFEMVAKQADPWCVMSSYPKVNGAHIDAQPLFLRDILRKEWGFNGLVMSDWGATSNCDDSLKYGLDVETPGPAKHRTLDNVQASLAAGRITEKDVDDRVLALLKLLRQTGKLTDRRDTPAEQAIDRPEHRALIREAGAAGIVLLKNDSSKNKDGSETKAAILPVDATKCRKIALVGPLVDHAAAHGGGSASLNCHYKVSPYEAFKTGLGSDVEVTTSKGANITRAYPDVEAGAVNRNGNAGFIADYYKTPDFSGEPFHTEEYPRGAFTTLMNTSAVGAKSARFTSTYTAPISGTHYLSFSGLGPSKLFINGELVTEQPKELRDSMAFLLGVQDEIRFQHTFVASKVYELVIESIPSPTNNAELHLLENLIAAHLGFVPQADMEADLLAEAVGLASEADLAICFVGNTAQWETEGQDMAEMTLPADGSQDRLVAAVAKANPNTIVVVTTGVPVALPWLGQVPAVLQAWYAGQETGNAIFDTIFGAVSPSGKLPVSWPKRYEDSPCFGNFGLDSYDSQVVEYVEGVHVGYRHFDRTYGKGADGGEVLFPFGFGLSYTSFAFADAALEGTFASTKNETVTVSVTVTNTGAVAGSETVQLYLAPPAEGAGAGRPPKSLVAFEKLHLSAGESKRTQLTFSRDGAAYWVEGQAWRVDGGRHSVTVATSSSPRDVKATLELDIKEAFDFAS